MPFTIIRQDITKMNTDAIVNAANRDLLMGGGVCGAIFRAAGAIKLQAACRRAAPVETGGAAITPGFRLRAKYVIHAVGPVYRESQKEQCEAQLRSTYTEALKLAEQHHCQSIAFPLISSGIYGYPKEEALRVATEAIGEFLTEHEMDVYLAVYDRNSFVVSEKLLGAVESYIDEHYVEAHPTARRLPEENLPDTAPMPMPAPGAVSAPKKSGVPAEEPLEPEEAEDLSENVWDVEAVESNLESAPRPEKHKGWGAPIRFGGGLDERLSRMDEPFSAALLKLIDAKGMTDVQVYKKANLDRKLFSKIRTGKHYTPKKPTILALAVALELTLPETDSLLERAGYALSHASKFDVIVEYFILSGNYDVFEINEVLFHYDQPLLGG